MAQVFVVADPGGTHGGDLDQLLQLVDVAAAAGADAFKAQWLSSPEVLAVRRNAGEYVAAYRNIAFPPAWHELLARRCEQAGVEYMCTCFLACDLPVLAPYLRRWKIASMEARDCEFLRAHPPHAQVIVSTGAMDEAEVDVLHRALLARQGAFALLHCVSAYPALPEAMNLAVLLAGHRVYAGLSDHSCSPLVAGMAVACGAAILEAHLRLDDCPPGNADYPHSMPPTRFAEYVAAIRQAEAIMGTGDKRVMPSEAPWVKYSVRP